MLDKVPIRTPSTARLIECPPRREAKPADPCALVIFGATGDLTKRLVVPALYNLSRSKVLPEQFALIGVARSDGTAESWRERLYDMLKSFVGHAGAEFNTDNIDEGAWARLADKMAYISGDLTKPDLYEKLRSALDEAENAHGTRSNVIFYLAIADRLFGTVVEQLGKAKLTDQGEDLNGGRRCGGHRRRQTRTGGADDPARSRDRIGCRCLVRGFGKPIIVSREGGQFLSKASGLSFPILFNHPRLTASHRLHLDVVS